MSEEVLDRQEILQLIQDTANKEYGEGSILYGEQSISDVEPQPSGVLSLDIALGVGGWPKGRIIEIYGAEGSGKTTLALHAIAEAQKRGKIAAFVDAEHALDPTYAEAIGVDMDELLLSQPDYGEQALGLVEILINSKHVSVVVVDSVAALIPKKELDGEIEDIEIGAQARLMSKSMRRIKSMVNKSQTVLIFINQIRSKIGVMFGGNPNTTPGGRALKFYASVRVEVKRIGGLHDGTKEKNIGQKVIAKCVKNKVSPPFKEAAFDLVFGKGASRGGCIMDVGLDMGILKKSGSWTSHEGEKIGNGRLATVKFLEENKLGEEIEEEIRRKCFGETDIPDQ